MSSCESGGVSKCKFLVECGEEFEIQFNPTEFKFDKGVGWKDLEAVGKESRIEFEKVQPAKISMELLFDTTSNNADVRKVWVNRFLEMTNQSVNIGSQKWRPPIVEVVWGGFVYSGVAESVNVTYTMFAKDGHPIRAKLSLKMKEWVSQEFTHEGTATPYVGPEVILVTVQGGQTMSQIASDNNCTQRELMEANPEVDPTNIQAGDQLQVPSNGSQSNAAYN